MRMDTVARFTANRRSFLKGAGIAGIGLATTAVIDSKFGSAEQTVSAAAYSDADILNFALNLEYLEAEFYAVATYGATLVTLGVIPEADTTGPTTGGNMVKEFSSSPQAVLATALRNDEINHVRFLRTALGSSAAKKPAIDLNALGYGFSSVNSWLKLARQFEDVGVSAYLGAAPLISNRTYLSAAAAILGVEAQHSGSLRLACIQNAVSSPAVDSLDIPPTPKAPYDDNAKGLSIPRTVSQVLNIVYHGGRCSGGFYPNGMNGSIVCQS
ncbi:ferritin-like domain-containing protein [Alloacidobacterium dinghuense]|uniref:Ferritin-like domain-containing protein n=1 Tax=Alloacidobacterium dinghuense TaxID=2763107 RepID=A0A7G8BDV8_9BACT|nr:ferritin-like domain-containing protein [Alloacidobacterium dinghuense]QNI30728.1 ferritin-like domain-containing protein [Alloacidobacterium dinghuense]